MNSTGKIKNLDAWLWVILFAGLTVLAIGLGIPEDFFSDLLIQVGTALITASAIALFFEKLAHRQQQDTLRDELKASRDELEKKLKQLILDSSEKTRLVYDSGFSACYPTPSKVKWDDFDNADGDVTVILGRDEAWLHGKDLAEAVQGANSVTVYLPDWEDSKVVSKLSSSEDPAAESKIRDNLRDIKKEIESLPNKAHIYPIRRTLGFTAYIKRDIALMSFLDQGKNDKSKSPVIEVTRDGILRTFINGQLESIEDSTKIARKAERNSNEPQPQKTPASLKEKSSTPPAETISSTQTIQEASDAPKFEIWRGRAREKRNWATATVGTDGGLIVLKGSQARKWQNENHAGYKPLQDELIETGILAEKHDGGLVFTENYEFDSASAASCVVLGQNSNGRTTWTVVGDRKKTYSDWLNEE
ncbi:DUF4357 domain-containing protein [Nesterenkonia populi]